MTHCQGCGAELAPSTRPRRYCPGVSTCRVKAFNARAEVRREVAFDLLLRQTQAILDGDTARLEAIGREAERFLAA